MNSELIERVARAIAQFVVNAPEDRQQIPAIQFILNRNDDMARAVVAALPEPSEEIGK